MLPSAFIVFTPTPSVLIKNFEDKKYRTINIEERTHAPLAIPQIEKLKNEQLIAGMAFRFFGLQNMPIYNADTAFLQDRNFIELPLQAKQLLEEMKQYYDFVQNGHIYSNRVSKYKSDLAIDMPNSNILSFSITMQEKEIVLVYNTSKAEAYEKFIMLNLPSAKDCTFLATMYGYDTNSNIQVFNSVFNEIKMCYIRLYLKPMQLVILKNFSRMSV